MKRTISVFPTTIAALLVATMARAADSAPFRIDTRLWPRVARATEPLVYSTDWNGVGACSIALDGEPLLSSAAGTGDYAWDTRAASVGLHTLTFDDGVETLTARFTVNPAVTDVAAKQRYPWNGKVDISCTVSGLDGGNWAFAVETVMPDTGEVRRISDVHVVRDGVLSSDLEAQTNGAYRLVWDVRADLGQVRCSNMVVRVNLEEGHGKVQLWGGGPYWATTNIGAEEPEDYGLYFWWGDTVGYRREGNAWVASGGSLQNFRFGSGNTPTRNKSTSTLQSEGWTTSAGVLAPMHDAAHIHWGGNWRMPTKDELSSLSSNCDWTWTTRNGVNGYVVSGRGDYSEASIFLPAAGYGGILLFSAGSYGRYWSSVPYSDNNKYSWCLRFDSGDHDAYYIDCHRDRGQPVRPVQGFAE